MLSAFVMVAKHGGITAAAASLGVAKSIVSKRLSTLEGLLQIKLFERASRRVALTVEGKSLLARAESILAELDNLVGDAQEQVALVRGTVRIAASPEFGTLLTGRFLPALLQHHLALKVAISLEYRFDNLHDPSVDLAFRLGSINDDRLVGKKLGEFSRVLVCSAAYARSCVVDSPSDLMKVNALIFSDREFEEGWLLRSVSGGGLQQQIKVQGRLCVHGFEALTAAALAGLGIARLPSFVAAPRLTDGTLVRILPEWRSPTVPVYLAFRPGVSRVGRIRAVIDFASHTLPSLIANLSGDDL